MNSEKLRHVSAELKAIAKDMSGHGTELTDLAALLENEADELLTNGNDTNREWALKYIWKIFAGVPYLWGGDDMEGIDCSGLAVEYMKRGGLVRENFDTNAMGLWIIQQNKIVGKPYRGCLVYWHARNNRDKIVHVEIVWTPTLSLGARGGGSKTVNKDIAMQQNAYVKLSSFATRQSTIKGFTDPFLP